ncbi:MAG: glycosyltransferase 87 family protein, partial [Bdellovibrionota bacterium]
ITRLLPARYRRHALFLSGLCVLLTLRYAIDALWCGQVTGLILLCQAGALASFAWRKKAWAGYLAGVGLLIPTVLKVGPGILYIALLPFFFSRRDGKFTRRALFSSVVGFAALSVLGAPSGSTLGRLWSGWWLVAGADAEYFDPTHLGSQSFKSVLARIGVTTDLLEPVWLFCAALGALGLVLFAFVPAASSRSRGSKLEKWLGIISLGVVWNFVFMPETFKYALSGIAICLVPLLARLGRGAADGLTQTALIACALFMSMPSLDVVGESLANGIQLFSLPFVALILLGAAIPRRTSRNARLDFGSASVQPSSHRGQSSDAHYSART